jgi:hypothetical protein
MNGTDLRDGIEYVPDPTAVPLPVASVRLGEIRTFCMLDDEDEPILVVTDGDTTVEFACGLSGRSLAAALGAQRLAAAVQAYASTIESDC